MLNERDVARMIAEGESETVEFKTDIREAGVLAGTLAAFANTRGGTVLVGVREPDVVIGSDAERIGRLLQRSLDMLSPRIEVGFEAIPVGGRVVSAITVKPSLEVVFSDGQALGRVRDRIKALSPTQLTDKLGSPAYPSELAKLAESISLQTTKIESLRDELRDANSPKSKMKDYFIGEQLVPLSDFFFHYSF